MIEFQYIIPDENVDEQTARAWNRRLNQDSDENKDLCYMRNIRDNAISRMVRPRWFWIESTNYMIQRHAWEAAEVIVPMSHLPNEMICFMRRDPFFAKGFEMWAEQIRKNVASGTGD